MKVRGTVEFRDVEMGVWVLVGEDGRTYQISGGRSSLLKEGQRNLRDPGFLTSPSLGFDNDYLRYEKAMLDEWMKREFVKR